jgi:hypothetical protein
VPYHHRTSVGVVGRSALAPDRLRETAREVARAVALFDQRGCVSIRTIYVEEGGEGDPQGFARALAGALDALEGELPSGELGRHEAAALQQERSTTEMLAASAAGVAVHHGGVAPWTVIFTADPAFEPACPGGRMAVVRPLASLEALPAALEPGRAHLQTLGVAGVDGQRRRGLGIELARLGASRIVPFRAVPFPPPWWHHDGRGPLADLVRWADVEFGE